MTRVVYNIGRFFTTVQIFINIEQQLNLFCTVTEGGLALALVYFAVSVRIFLSKYNV